jgi:ketosteroid isomerase-like protein
MTNADTDSVKLAAARRMIECVTSGDLAGIEGLYHDDIRVWRNFAEGELVKRQAVKIVGFVSKLADLEYADLRIEESESGFVQQHVLCCTGPKGDAVRVPACIVARVDADGRILRIDEYADSKAMAPLMG